MRVESDRQGHHSSEAPACHRCGVPLLEDATFCPYCERWLDDGPAPRRVLAVQARFIPSRRVVLAAGSVLFALIAVASIVAAFLV